MMANIVESVVNSNGKIHGYLGDVKARQLREYKITELLIAHFCMGRFTVYLSTGFLRIAMRSTDASYDKPVHDAE